MGSSNIADLFQRNAFTNAVGCRDQPPWLGNHHARRSLRARGLLQLDSARLSKLETMMRSWYLVRCSHCGTWCANWEEKKTSRLDQRCLSSMVGADDGALASFISYTTSQYKLHYYETPTNIKFVMLTDLKSPSMRIALQQIYINLFVEYGQFTRGFLGHCWPMLTLI